MVLKWMLGPMRATSVGAERAESPPTFVKPQNLKTGTERIARGQPALFSTV
jgi:hypothetical protein